MSRWGTPQNFLLAFIDESWKTRKIRTLKKWKKIAEDIMILHNCTKNHNHMRYSCWDTEWGKFVLSFWVNFCPFHSFLLSPPNLTTQTTKILKKWKNHVEMSLFWTCPKKRRNKMMHTHSDMECNRHNFLLF